MWHIPKFATCTHRLAEQMGAGHADTTTTTTATCCCMGGALHDFRPLGGGCCWFPVLAGGRASPRRHPHWWRGFWWHRGARIDDQAGAQSLMCVLTALAGNVIPSALFGATCMADNVKTRGRGWLIDAGSDADESGTNRILRSDHRSLGATVVPTLYPMPGTCTAPVFSVAAGIGGCRQTILRRPGHDHRSAGGAGHTRGGCW